MSEIRILGGTNMTGSEQNPKILDSRSKTEPVKPEIRIHEEVIIEEDRVRHEKREPGEPEVRIRQDAGTFKRSLGDDDD